MKKPPRSRSAASPPSASKLFRNQKEWEAWLEKYSGTSPGLWMRLAKKSGKLQSVTYQEALESALCFGWIDGQKKSFDDASWLQRFTPRGAKSIWSKINRASALRLMEAGRMRPAGLAAVERGRESGSWGRAYDSHKTALPPRDFQTALNGAPRAKAFFATLNSQNRYAILFRIQTARKPGTRQKRIDQFVKMLADHKMIHPPKKVT